DLPLKSIHVIRVRMGAYECELLDPLRMKVVKHILAIDCGAADSQGAIGPAIEYDGKLGALIDDDACRTLSAQSEVVNFGGTAHLRCPPAQCDKEYRPGSSLRRPKATFHDSDLPRSTLRARLIRGPIWRGLSGGRPGVV